MNCDEAKTILLLYRPGTTDAEDAQTAEALALARSDPALARRWKITARASSRFGTNSGTSPRPPVSRNKSSPSMRR